MQGPFAIEFEIFIKLWLSWNCLYDAMKCTSFNITIINVKLIPWKYLSFLQHSKARRLETHDCWSFCNTSISKALSSCDGIGKNVRGGGKCAVGPILALLNQLHDWLLKHCGVVKTLILLSYWKSWEILNFAAMISYL